MLGGENLNGINVLAQIQMAPKITTTLPVHSTCIKHRFMLGGKNQ